MGKCPFWSTTSDKIACNSECPMNSTQTVEDVCVFKEVSIQNKFNFKDIIEDEFVFSDAKVLKLDTYLHEGNY